MEIRTMGRKNSVKSNSGWNCMECGKPASLKAVSAGECGFCGGGDFDMPTDAESVVLAKRYAELKKDRGY